MKKIVRILCFIVSTAFLFPLAFLLTASAARNEENVVQLVSCDTGFGNFQVDKNDAQEGSACVTYKFKTGSDSFANGIKFSAVDGSNADALAFELYVSDPNMVKKLDQLCIEITSSGTYDVEELAWHGITLLGDLETGWNTVYLYLEDTNASGVIDMTRVNFLRIYAFFKGSNLDGEEMKFDNIRLCYVGGPNYSDMNLHYNQGTTKTQILVQGLEKAPSYETRDQGITVNCGKKK